MREIRFRAKTINGGQWIKGDLFRAGTEPSDGEFAISYWDEESGWMNENVLPETIGQYTGLKDKNGKEIYEGDIIYSEFCDKSGGNSLVGWNEKTSSFGIMDEYSYRSIEEGFDFPEFKNYVLLAHLKDALICEVIGNIHDNPDLLKETSNLTDYGTAK